MPKARARDAPAPLAASMAEFTNYYSILGVTKSASREEIKKAFQFLAKDLHPDLNPGASAAARFQLVKEAYDVLRDPNQKNVFDKKLDMNVSASYDPEELRRRADAFKEHRSRCSLGASSCVASACMLTAAP